MSGPQADYTLICETAAASGIKHSIRPDDFNLDSPNTLQGTFGKAEVEWSVGKLLEFFQSRGYWCEFTIDELARFYKLKGWDPAPMFYGLAATRNPQAPVFLVGDRYGKYCVTDLFIERCAKNLKKLAA